MKYFLGWVIVIGVICGASVCAPQSVGAVTTATTNKGLTVSPVRTEVSIDAGTVRSGQLTLTNTTPRPMNVSLTSEAFSVINEQYDYAFTVDADVASWVRFDMTNVVLAPSETKKVAYDIAAPLSAEPGGHYISLFSNNDTDISGDGIASRQRIASLLYINVNGDVSRFGRLVSLAVPFLITDPSNWSMTLQNSGSTHYRSAYSASLYNVFGGQITSTAGSALVLPTTVRAVADNLPMPTLPGLYKLQFDIGLGDTPGVTEIRYIVYAPPLFLAAVVAVIGTVIVVLIYSRSQRKD